jgi:pimeloyl-ACP methyl ester carboxylesterase
VTVLDVPGAHLCYQTHGSGPLMIMIPGASGVADGFRMVTEHLASHYTVLLYDRRGFSRSQVDGLPDYAQRLKTDADDVRLLIENVSDEPATVFGASSGGVVALKLLIRHPAWCARSFPSSRRPCCNCPTGSSGWTSSTRCTACTAEPDAVRDFQRDRGLQVDGIVGNETWPALIVLVSSGSRGDAVRAVQRQLNARSSSLAIDGVFGPQTALAIRRFQQANGLLVDGIVGPDTWYALVTAPAAGPTLRRNIAKVSEAERNKLRDAILQLDITTYPDGVSFWDKQDQIHQATHVHGGPAFIPWHRELINRFEALLRQIDPTVALHYWDWQTDPRSSPGGAGGTVNLFSTGPDGFMGSASGRAGPPLDGFDKKY